METRFELDVIVRQLRERANEVSAQLLFDIRYVLQIKPRFGPKVEDYLKVRGSPASKCCRYPGFALEFAKVAEAQLR
ncbi:hypothetical protein [Bradyrhizobium sp. USDA 4452]